MEIVDGETRSRGGLVEIAFAATGQEAVLIRGLLEERGIHCLTKGMSVDGPRFEYGALTRIEGRIYVRPADAEAARRILTETMVEDPGEIPEPANAGYLADASGHRPRNYNVIGAFARAYVAAAVIFAVTLAIFLLLHQA